MVEEADAIFYFLDYDSHTLLKRRSSLLDYLQHFSQ